MFRSMQNTLGIRKLTGAVDSPSNQAKRRTGIRSNVQPGTSNVVSAQGQGTIPSTTPNMSTSPSGMPLAPIPNRNVSTRDLQKPEAASVPASLPLRQTQQPARSIVRRPISPIGIQGRGYLSGLSNFSMSKPMRLSDAFAILREYSLR